MDNVCATIDYWKILLPLTYQIFIVLKTTAHSCISFFFAHVREYLLLLVALQQQTHYVDYGFTACNTPDGFFRRI